MDCVEVKTKVLRENDNDNNKWVNIPNDMLEEVMKRLALKDYIGLCIVCSTWRAIVADAIAKKHCHPIPEIPLIILKSKSKGSRFFSLSTEREHSMKKRLLASTQTCHGTIEGWLIVGKFSEGRRSNGWSFSFFNPVTNDRIIIPSKLNYLHKSLGLYMRKMKASSKPNSYCTSDCYLVGLVSDFCHIAVYKLFDKSWMMIEADEESGTCFLDFEVIGTILYVKTDKSLYSILVYDLKDCTEGGPNIQPKVIAKLPEIRPLPTSIIVDNQRTDINYPMCGLAKDEFGELYLICSICDAEYNTQNIELNVVKEFVKAPQITSVQVYKFDMMSEKNPSKWWKRVSLEDHVVFYSGVNIMVLSKGALNWNEELFRGNSLYFALSYPCSKDDPWSGLKLGMFCMTDNTTKYFSLDTSNHPNVPFPFWFIPSIS